MGQQHLCTLPLLFIVDVPFLQSAAKFSLERAQECLDWIEAVTERKIDYPEGEGVRDQNDFGAVLKNGQILCE